MDKHPRVIPDRFKYKCIAFYDLYIILTNNHELNLNNSLHHHSPTHMPKGYTKPFKKKQKTQSLHVKGKETQPNSFIMYKQKSNPMTIYQTL